MLQDNSFPRHIQLQTHSKCSMACSICPHPVLQRNKDSRLMSWADFCKIADEALMSPSFESIVLDLQNEPTLDRDLARRIRYLRQGGRTDVFIGLTTNGLTFDREVALELFGAGLSRAVFSLNALNKEDYALVAPGIDYGRIRANLDELLETEGLKENTVVSFGVSRSNVDQALRFADEMRRRGARFRVFPLGDRLGLARNVEKLAIPPLFESCHYPLYAMPITLSGDVILCCHDWSRDLLLGNVLTTSVHEVWNGAPYRNVREQASRPGERPHEICRTCDSPYEYGGHARMNDLTLGHLASAQEARVTRTMS